MSRRSRSQRSEAWGALAPVALLLVGCAADLTVSGRSPPTEDAEAVGGRRDGSGSDGAEAVDGAGPDTPRPDAHTTDADPTAGDAAATLPDAAPPVDLAVPADAEPDRTPDAASAPDAESVPDAEPDADAGAPALPVCDCFVRAAWCAEGVLAEVAARGLRCRVPLAERRPEALLGCDGDRWVVREACTEGCEAQPPGTPDACAAAPLPVCDCFVQVAWCGAGVAREAEDRGCRVPLLPEHDGDILACQGDRWVVGQACDRGCVEAPPGVPDSCHDEGTYRLPYACGDRYLCTNGNDSNTHTGMDQFAFDFGMPRGTPVLAMRAGRVLRVRNVSAPGDRCYDTGDRDCANLANTVEIRHNDGTVALYMHLQRGTVAQGAQVRQGQQIGLSGNSGWSTGPHLHVQVQRDCGIWWCQSIRFGFAEDARLVRGDEPRSQNCP